MSTDQDDNNPTRHTLRLAEKGQRIASEQPEKSTLPRQFVTFTFYKARPEWHALDESGKHEAKRELAALFDSFKNDLLINSYSIIGLRSNVDIMIWRIGYTLDPLQEMSARINATRMGRYLEVTQSFLSMTKRSMYIDKDNPEHVEDRLHIVPGKSKYLFDYTFVKTRAWYMLPFE